VAEFLISEHIPIVDSRFARQSIIGSKPNYSVRIEIYVSDIVMGQIAIVGVIGCPSLGIILAYTTVVRSNPDVVVLIYFDVIDAVGRKCRIG
jgi:ABC-type arginine transport system permease subunit